MPDEQRPLIFRIRSLSNQIKRLMERSAIEKNEANLTGMQYAILGFLAKRGDEADVFQRDIEAEFNIRRSTATGMVQLLEKQGYICREVVPDDARLKKIRLTTKAEELDKFARANMDELEAKLVRGITPDELEWFYRVLRKISDNARDCALK